MNFLGLKNISFSICKLPGHYLMFQEDEDQEAILFVDEVDSFLRDRQQTYQSWEVTKANELLGQLERFKGIFICATNLRD